jgi:hypothetical protein
MNAVLEPVFIGSGPTPDRNPGYPGMTFSRQTKILSDAQMLLWLVGEAGSAEARFENILKREAT